MTRHCAAARGAQWSAVAALQEISQTDDDRAPEQTYGLLSSQRQDLRLVSNDNQSWPAAHGERLIGPPLVEQTLATADRLAVETDHWRAVYMSRPSE
jgi:hypothetical protein